MNVERRFWLGWWLDEAHGGFELSRPWWLTIRSKGGEPRKAVVAAVIAADPETARQEILDGFDSPPGDLGWLFCVEQGERWSPFTESYQRADWMQWPGSLVDQANEAARPPGPAPNGWPDPVEVDAAGFARYDTECSVCGRSSATVRDYTASDDTRRLVCVECLVSRARTGRWPHTKAQK